MILRTCSFLLAISSFAAEPADLVRQAAQGWTSGAVRSDAAALERYLADDLRYAHAGGNLQNKGQYIASVTEGPPRYESFTFSDLKIRFYGDSVVLTAYVDMKMVGQSNFRVRTLQVYTKSGGHWQMAAHRSTRIAR